MIKFGRLPLTLRLTPKPLPWSRIFHQEVTLALPFTLAEALPASSPAQGAFGTFQAGLTCLLVT